MSRQKRSVSIPAAPADTHVLKFVSRAEQLYLRGRRNFDRYMRVIKKYVAFDGPKHAQWQKESAEDAVWDAEWNKASWPRARRREDSPLATRRRAATFDIFRREYRVSPWQARTPEVHPLQAVVSQLALSRPTRSTRVH